MLETISVGGQLALQQPNQVIRLLFHLVAFHGGNLTVRLIKHLHRASQPLLRRVEVGSDVILLLLKAKSVQ